MFSLIARKKSRERNYGYLTLFFAWSLAIFALSNVVSEQVTGGKILEFTGVLEPKEVTLNGEKIHGGDYRPFVAQIGGQEDRWEFNLGYINSTQYILPAILDEDGDTLEVPCLLIEDARGNAALESGEALYEQFLGNHAHVDTDCRETPLGYAFLSFNEGHVFADSNIINFDHRLIIPPKWGNQLDKAVIILDRTCLANGFYAACVEFVDPLQFSASIILVMIFVYPLTYATAFGLVDRLFFKSPAFQSISKFLFLNVTYLVLFITTVLIASIAVLLGVGFFLPVASVVVLSAVHLFRSVQLFGPYGAANLFSRTSALVLGIFAAWTFGSLLFIPVQFVLVIFHDSISALL